MTLLLDTHILLWAMIKPKLLSAEARDLLQAPTHSLVFSVASLWEIAIKRSLGRKDFDVDPRILRRAAIENGYQELEVKAAHAFGVEGLPHIHKDPFDRLLIAQAMVEGLLLVTADKRIAQYPAPVRKI